MNRPPLEVADLVRAAGHAFIERSRKWITWQHLKVLRAIARCRTAALGGHLDECTDCAYRPPISYNSCRNRHCPKCQANARDRWLQARRQELPPYVIFHDSTLLEVARQRPISLMSLAMIPGVGVSKLERYGSAIIGMVAQMTLGPAALYAASPSIIAPVETNGLA